MRGFQPAGVKPLQKKSSGPVRGPGTGTSDEVADTVADGTYIMPTDSAQAIGEQNLAAMGKGAPVNVQLSNGEFKMPPEQVHAVGVQALDQMKDATHLPAVSRGFAPGAQQQAEPPLFFANGGVVDEEAKRAALVNQIPTGGPAAPANDGSNNSTEFTRNVNNGINALGGMGVVASVPLKGAQAATKAVPSVGAAPMLVAPVSKAAPAADFVAGMGSNSAVRDGATRMIGNMPTPTLPATNAALQHGAQANQLAAATRTAAGAGSGANHLDANNSAFGAAPAVPAASTPDPMQGMAAFGFNPNIQRQAENRMTRTAAPAPQPQVLPTQVEGWRTKAVMDGAAQDAQAAWDRGSVMGAAGAVTRGAVTAIPTAVGEFAYNTVAPVVRGLGSFYDGLTGNSPAQTAAPAAQPAAAAAPAASTAVARTGPAPTPPVAAAADGAGQGRGAVSPPMANPSAAVPTSSQPVATQIQPGVFRSGNSFGDSAQAAITGAQPRGLPSAQNVAAADALAQQSAQASAGRVAAGQPVERGWSGQIGTDPAVGRERKELVSALMTPLKGAQNGQLTAAQRSGMLSLLDQEARGAQAKANNATALQQTEMQGVTQRDLAAMRESGDNGRAVLREAGETGRAGARNAIDQGRLGLEQQAKGFQIRFGEREEKLHQRYEAAKTSEEKAAIALQIRDLSGKAEPTNRFTVVPGGQEWDATAGAMRNVPGRVLNNQSGQFVEQGGAAQAAPAGMPKVGDVRNGHRYKGGNPNDQANWAKV